MGVGWNWRCTESFRREDVEGQIWGIRMESSEGGKEKRASDHPISEVVGFFFQRISSFFQPFYCIESTLIWIPFSSLQAEGQISNSELDELLSPPYLCIPATLHQDYQHRQLQKEFE